MTDEMIAEAKDEASPEERRLRKMMARVLWSTEADLADADAATRKTAFAEARPVYLKKAKRLMRQMDKRGITLALAATSAPENDED